MKKIICLITVISMMVSGISALAVSETISIEWSGTTVKVGGTSAGCAGMPVTIGIINDSLNILLPKQITADVNDTYSVTFSTADLQKGYTYTVKVGGAVTAGTTLYYPTDNELTAAIAAFNNASVSEIETLLSHYNAVLNLNLTKYNSVVNKTAVANGVIGKNFTTRDELNEAFKTSVNEVLNDETVFEIYVSESGSDTADGTLSAPFATIAKAKDCVKELLAENSEYGSIHVNVEDGSYNLSEPIIFTEDDCSANVTVTYRGYGTSQPVISGAKTVTDWVYYQNGIYYTAFNDDVNNLFEDGKTALKARYPNAVNGESQFLEATQSASGASKTAFAYSAGDFPIPSDITDLETYIWSGGESGSWMWFSNIEDITSVADNTVTLADDTRYVIGTGSKYYLQGALEFLDEPGEYYYDSTAKRLYYMPVGDMASCTITAAEISNCFVVRGESDTARNIVIENMEFCGTNRTDANDESNGYITDTGAAIVTENTENITICNCRIHDVGGDGVFMLNYNRNNTVYGNKIYNVGRHGAETAGADETKPVNDSLISNNEITNGSLFIGHGQGIYLGSKYGTNNHVSNNTIKYFKRIGIDVSENHGGTNYIEYNDVSHVNTESEDSGLIYAVNQYDGAGAVVRNNYLHHSGMYEGGGFGIYFDNNAHNCIAENNVITALGQEGNGYIAAAIVCKGDNNVVKNNYILNNALTMAAIMSYAQGNTAENLQIEKNITEDSGNTMYRFINWTDERIVNADYNLFYSSDDSYYFRKVSTVYDMAAWNTLGFDTHSLCEVPLLSADFMLDSESPAIALGIEQIDVRSIGLRSDFIFERDTAETVIDSYITSAVLLTEDKEVADSLGSNCRYVNIGISSPSSTEEEVTVIAAQYDGNELTYVKLFNAVKVPAVGSAICLAELASSQITQDSTLKVMVWNSIWGMKPLCPVRTVD